MKQIDEPIEVPWSTARQDASPEAAKSGHGGLDFFTFAHFADTLLRNIPLEFDIYRACDSAAPAIMAACSIKEGSKALEVPDFRPNNTRKSGKYPQ